MDIASVPQAVEAPKGPVVPHSQSVDVLAGLDPMLDDAAVRDALTKAEAQGVDPMKVDVSALSTLSQDPATQTVQAPVVEPVQTPEVPQKFLKPDGGVDVDKLVTSTKALEEAVQKKEAAITKTVDDYLKEYQELENRFRNSPNPQRLAANLPPVVSAPEVPPVPVVPQQMTDQQLEELINKDLQANPSRTITQLIQMALDNRLKPIEQDKQIQGIRGNIAKIAESDPRVLRPDVFQAINQKLQSDPDLWKLKNPHRSAWLEVKEEMRLGEPSQVQAQPSKPLSPVLGGGTPPSAPSSSVPSPQNVLANLDKINLRDPKQEELADEAIRAMLSRSR